MRDARSTGTYLFIIGLPGFADDVSRDESSTLIYILKLEKTAENYKKDIKSSNLQMQWWRNLSYEAGYGPTRVGYKLHSTVSKDHYNIFSLTSLYNRYSTLRGLKYFIDHI